MDDSNCVGHRKAINYVMEELEKKFKIKKLILMKEYFSCTMRRDQNGFQLSQSDIIKKLEYQFRAVVKD